jgi:hypothetical protein
LRRIPRFRRCGLYHRLDNLGQWRPVFHLIFGIRENDEYRRLRAAVLYWQEYAPIYPLDSRGNCGTIAAANFQDLVAGSMGMKSLRLLAVLAVTFSAGPALADRLDGDWCSADGKHLHIEGQNIEIPSGLHITGDYQRHYFSYTAPAGDPEEGQFIHMQQQSDEVMHLWRQVGGKDGPAETWRRCEFTS